MSWECAGNMARCVRCAANSHCVCNCPEPKDFQIRWWMWKRRLNIYRAGRFSGHSAAGKSELFNWRTW